MTQGFAQGGERNDGKNVGTGVGVYKQKNADNEIELHSLKAAASGDLTITDIGDEIEFDLNIEARATAATANTIAKRDASGRLKAAAPVASDDVARKAEVDAISAIPRAYHDVGSGAASASNYTGDAGVSITLPVGDWLITYGIAGEPQSTSNIIRGELRADGVAVSLAPYATIGDGSYTADHGPNAAQHLHTVASGTDAMTIQIVQNTNQKLVYTSTFISAIEVNPQ